MATPESPLLRALVQLAESDVTILRLQAERGKIESDLTARMEAHRKLDLERQKRGKLLEEKRSVYDREERRLRDERDKLTERRKALNTLGAYKLQQAATKEIEFVSRQLDQQEEKLLEVMVEVETLEKAANEVIEGLAKSKSEFDVVARESKEALATIESRSREHSERRAAVAKEIPPKDLTTYTNVRAKFPMNPVVAVNGNTCSGCFMTLGPQVHVQLSRGVDLVRCPGCGRLLFMPGEAQAA